jgi:porin
VAAEYSDPNTALISTYVDGGIVRHGTFATRPNDSLAIGFAEMNFNPRLQQLQLALRGAGYVVPYNGSESVVEMNYGWQATKWLVVRPGMQYVLNPKGEETNPQAGLTVPGNALVFGLATDVTF